MANSGHKAYFCDHYMNTALIRATALRTIELEAQSVAGLQAFIDTDFERAIAAITATRGRIIISGIGKSAIIAQKIVATFNSTGTPAVFLHAADAIHGDLGILQPEDLVMLISKSGESPEIKVLVPLIKGFGNTLIGMVGNTASFLATHSDMILNTTVAQEACPNNLAPTTSTTAQLVMGDVLAVVLMELKGFSSEDFAKFHPGGALGKRLFLRVQDLYADNEKPVVQPDAPLRTVILEISVRRLGATAVADATGRLLGIITDGDLRRLLEKNQSLENITAADIMNTHARSIIPDELAVEALDMMRKNNISQLVVADEQGMYKGIIHLHDLVREGII
jgi:arabinose-5-phosphate isomerase